MSGSKICKLSEVITIQNGYAFSSKKFTAEKGIPLIRIRDLKNGITTQTKYSGDFDKTYLVKSGDLLIGMDGEFKCYEWKGSPALLNQRVCRIQNINETFDLKYLYYGINSHLKAIEDVTGYTTVKHLSSSTILNIEFPVPSLEKQRDIVEKLDKTFAEIDSLEKNLQLKQEKTNQLLQSMLSAAFTNTEQFAMTKIALKEVCDYFGDGDWIESKDQSDSGIRLIQTGNIGMGKFKDRIEKARWISEETFRNLRCTEIIEGDVLVSRLPDPVGRACLIPSLSHKAITAVDCAIIRFNSSRLIPKFFIYYSQSNEYYSTIKPLISGSTRERISREKLGNLFIPCPSIFEQKVIVERLDKAFAEIDKLKNQISIEKERMSSLRQSILSNAFNFEEKVA